MTDREPQFTGSAARAGDGASASPAAKATSGQGNGEPRIVRAAPTTREAPGADLRLPDPDPLEAAVDGAAPHAGLLDRDVDADERVGPYLLFDDDVDATAAMPAEAGVQPERTRRRPRRTLRSLLAALRAGATEGAERLEGAALWWATLRPATFALSAISVAIGALVAAGTGPFGAAEAGVAAAALAGVLAVHGGRNLLEHWSELGREGAGDRHAAGVTMDPSRDAARVAAMRLGRRGLLAGAGLAYLAGAAVLLLLVRVAGDGVAWFGAVGLALSLADVLPPLALKRRGAGAVAGAIAWGPVIVAGTAFAVRGEAPATAWLASVAFALAVGAALLGERLDARVGQEREAGAGDAALRDERGRDLVVKLAQLALVWVGALVVAGVITPWSLLVLLGLPRFRRLAVAYAPATGADGARRAAGEPYAEAAMRFARTTGALLALGLAVGLIA